jgi:hypothetical protein
MKSRIVMGVLLLSAAAYAADPKKPDPMMKDLIKDATTASEEKPRDPNAPDISKMPFTAESVQKIVGFYQPKIQECYEETLASKGDKPIEGKIVTAWVVTPDGTVKSAKVDGKKSKLKEPKLHDCVVAVLSTMEFPKPADGKDHPIEFPFNLKAVH